MQPCPGERELSFNKYVNIAFTRAEKRQAKKQDGPGAFTGPQFMSTNWRYTPLELEANIWVLFLPKAAVERHPGGSLESVRSKWASSGKLQVYLADDRPGLHVYGEGETSRDLSQWCRELPGVREFTAGGIADAPSSTGQVFAAGGTDSVRPDGILLPGAKSAGPWLVRNLSEGALESEGEGGEQTSDSFMLDIAISSPTDETSPAVPPWQAALDVLPSTAPAVEHLHNCQADSDREENLASGYSDPPLEEEEGELEEIEIGSAVLLLAPGFSPTASDSSEHEHPLSWPWKEASSSTTMRPSQ